MQNVTSLTQMEREITQILEQDQTPHITLTVPSMINETAEKIKLEVSLFNQMMDFLIENGSKCVYTTAEGNASISYDELLLLEDIVKESKQEIQAKDAQINAEKARIIEHIVSHKFQTIVGWGDKDFYSSCDKNLIQALKEKRGSCCHFATLTQYLHLRNNMYSAIIFSSVNVETTENEKIKHMFNLLFLEDLGEWTFVDTMWEKEILRIREQNSFSFVSLAEIQSNPTDRYEAHGHIEQDISNISTVSINMGSIDRKLGYQNRLYLFPYVWTIVDNITNGNFEKVKGMFSGEDETMRNLSNKNLMIQFIGLVTYISAIELGQSGLMGKEQREDESVMIRYLDTYLKSMLPDFYAMFFEQRIKINNPRALENANSLERYVTSLFQIITKEDGSVGVYFKDMIDKAYIGVDFTKPKKIPIVNVLNRMQFEERFDKIANDKTILKEPNELEYN